MFYVKHPFNPTRFAQLKICKGVSYLYIVAGGLHP